MSQLSALARTTVRGRSRWLWLVAFQALLAPLVHAGTAGKIQGRIVATDSGEPIGYADVALLPADTTLKRVGGLTNADGTYLLAAMAGKYTLRIRALSYATKVIEGITIEADQLLPFSTGLKPEAIQQEEVVVEAKRRDNTEASLLAARKKASSVGDAVSAEQVRRAPDKDAAEVLRRVTGLSVSDGKYVFVRGLGERYSSTEVDGVRLVSPEQNKRVVPLDLLPANLLENVVVQKTYTADRPGEFGGGDVQVRTKDFPGNRTWGFSVSQSIVDGVTFADRRTYAGSRSDLFGFGAASRAIPGVAAGGQLPPAILANQPHLASVARAFSSVWSTRDARTIPNGSYSATYGDEFKLFGRPLGLIESWSLSRGFDQQDESQRFFQGTSDTLYDYAVQRWTENAQLGGLSGLSYRLSPSHSLHLRGLFTNSAENEVRQYEGPDHNRVEAVTNTWLVHRNTRLTYIERSVLSGTAEGKHEFKSLLGGNLDWKFTRSRARRQQPDRREYTYDQRFYFEGDTAHWLLGSLGSREFGDMTDDGWGGSVTSSVPYRLGALGAGKISFGYDRQVKERDSQYRRFTVTPNQNYQSSELPVDSLFGPDTFDGSSTTGYIEEKTLNERNGSVDNYLADQRSTAGFVSADVPLGRRVRMNLGLRVENGFQSVRSYYQFRPDSILSEGELDDTDWLPSANVTVALTDAMNLRLAASRTVSRPDLNEMSPSPFLEYVGGFLTRGNPDLDRAVINNYDVRFEVFPALSEVFAAGFFYKAMQQPIEQVIQGGSPNLLIPRNSDKGRNLGVEIEARTSLARAWKRLEGLSINTNASIISSRVTLKRQITELGTGEHPLQGQARYLVNAALMYTTSDKRMDAALLFSATGRKLRTLGVNPLPDIYEEPSSSLDAAVNLTPFARTRIKLAAKNLTDPKIQRLQGDREVSAYRAGTSYSIALSYGS